MTVSTENATASKINYAIYEGLNGAHFLIEKDVTVTARAGATTDSGGERYGIVAGESGQYSVELEGTLKASGRTAALFVSRVAPYTNFQTPLSFSDVSTTHDGALVKTEEQATKENCAKYKSIIITNPNP